LGGANRRYLEAIWRRFCPITYVICGATFWGLIWGKIRVRMMSVRLSQLTSLGITLVPLSQPLLSLLFIPPPRAFSFTFSSFSRCARLLRHCSEPSSAVFDLHFCFLHLHFWFPPSLELVACFERGHSHWSFVWGRHFAISFVSPSFLFHFTGLDVLLTICLVFMVLQVFFSQHLSFGDNLCVKPPPPQHCSIRGMYWNAILYFIWSLLNIEMLDWLECLCVLKCYLCVVWYIRNTFGLNPGMFDPRQFCILFEHSWILECL